MIKCHRCGDLGSQCKLNYQLLRSLQLLSRCETSQDQLAPPSFPQPDPKTAILEIPKCEFCETNHAYFYCQTCSKLKYLCDDCYHIRHKNPSLDCHIRVPWKPQYDQNILCAEHSQECLIFCKTDMKPICTYCTYASSDHVGHETCLIETEIHETKTRIEKKLKELEKKGTNLQNISSEANQIYSLLSGNSFLQQEDEQQDSDSPSTTPATCDRVGRINQVIQDIHSHFYALRHLLQQKEEELVTLVKQQGQEKLKKLTQQIDDTALFLTKSYIFDQYLRQQLSEMPHYWVIEYESLFLQHIKKLIDLEGGGGAMNSSSEHQLRDHVIVTPEITFQSINPQEFLSQYQIHCSDDILSIQPLSTAVNGHLILADCRHDENDDDGVVEDCIKINDFLSDPIFSSPTDLRNESKSKFFTLAEEEPYVCFPGVTKVLTILSVGAFDQKIIVGGGGGELFHCTLEKQDIGVPPRRRLSGSGVSIGSTSSSKKHPSSRRSITPPHFRHNSSSTSHHTPPRSSTPPPTSSRTISLPRVASGSSLQSFGSPTSKTNPNKNPFHSTSFISQFSSLTPRTPPHISTPEPEDFEILDNNDGTYSLRLITQKEGLYRLNITLEGDHIRGSPFILHSEYHAEIIGSTGSAPGYFSSPYGVCYSPYTEQLYVADSSNNRIQIFSSTGEFVGAFGTHGKLNGQFSWPVGLCVSHDRIYVSDNMNNRIQIFALDGSYLNSIGLSNKPTCQLLTPYDLCCDGDLLFIADTGNKRIQVSFPISSSLLLLLFLSVSLSVSVS
jgi:hypothetical protein